jgi:hypothetical protein
MLLPSAVVAQKYPLLLLLLLLLQDRTMFPSDLWVRRLSGTGAESVFMGVLR